MQLLVNHIQDKINLSKHSSLQNVNFKLRFGTHVIVAMSIKIDYILFINP